MGTIRPIRIKFLTKATLYTGADAWRKRLPGGSDSWGQCHFTFDPAERNYDWLVVYEDLPSGHSLEVLSCPPERTVLFTSEPSSIKHYGTSFLRQFGTVVTSQEPWATRHPSIVRSQSGMVWWYAFDDRGAIDHLVANPPLQKTGGASTICSAKRDLFTIHRRRFEFTAKLTKSLPELVRFGRGVLPIQQKADAIAPFRLHVAIENHIAPHHFTEKLIDCYLGMALPVYIGAPNISDYFPEDSFVSADLRHPTETADTIRRLLRDDAWTKRLSAIREARRRVLEDYHVYALIASLVSRAQTTSPVWIPQSTALLSRHALRRSSFRVKAETFVEKTYSKVRTRWEQYLRPVLLNR